MTQNQTLPPPWELGSKDINDIPMLVVHMSRSELEGLDNLQGGPSVDEQTGMREYSELAPIVEIPEIRELFHDIANQVERHGDVSDDVKKAYKDAKSYSLPYRETDDEKYNPFLKRLEKMGRAEDTKLAYIPKNLAELLMEIRHVTTLNPESGLLEFWSFKNFLRSVVRVAGTVGGALLGGPIGAGIGRALAGAATGQQLGHAAMSGLQSGALSYGAQGLGQAAGLSGATPYSGGFFGGAPNALASGLSGMGIGKGIAPAAAATASGTQGMPAAQQLINSAFTQSQAPGLLGTIANVGNAIAPYAPLAVGALSYMGSKQHHKHLQKEHERQEAKWDEERKRLGWDIDWTPVAKKYEDNPDYWNITEDDIRHGRMEPYRREVGTRYAKGGLVQSYNKCALVKGRGKGQDDRIETTVPVESYIWDASSVSMLGDGSSEEGYKEIRKFQDDVKRKVPKKIRDVVERQVKKNTYQSPVYLSNDEVKSDPVFVSLLPYALGDKKISNEKGAAILRQTIKNLRKHKSQSGSGLPPKAKPLLEYARM